MITKQMKELYEQNKKRDNDNPDAVKDMWKKQITVLCASLPDTIEYLKNASPDEISYVAEVFDDVSAYWQSPELVRAMEEAVDRCPDDLKKLLQVDLKYATEALKT